MLASYIKHYWLLESDDITNSQRIIPTGNIELIFFRDRIFNTNDVNLCIQLIESFLMSQLNPSKEYYYKRMATAINAINLSNSKLSVSRLAETIALSEKQFQRIFCEHVGMPPKEFMRIIQFHKTLYVLQKNPTKNFMSLACECGYYVQAHMTHEFKYILGYTPTQYMEICTKYRLLLDFSPVFPSLPYINDCKE
jgi:UPI00006A2E02 related cluster